jgi:hypothetical protein
MQKSDADLLDALPPLWIDFANPLTDYTKLGIQAATTGNVSLGLQYFWAASHHSAYRADCWGNVAMASAELASQTLRQEEQRARRAAAATSARQKQHRQKKLADNLDEESSTSTSTSGRSSSTGSFTVRQTVHALACEGLKARALSALLKGVEQPDVEASLAALLAQFGGEKSCDGGGGSGGGFDGSGGKVGGSGGKEGGAWSAPTSQPALLQRRTLLARALKLSVTDAVAAANLLCTSHEAVSLSLPKKKAPPPTMSAASTASAAATPARAEAGTDGNGGRFGGGFRGGVLPAWFLLEALTLLRVCGVVAVGNLFEEELVGELQEAHSQVGCCCWSCCLEKTTTCEKSINLP